MRTLSTITLSPIIGVCLLLSLSACQPKPDAPPEAVSNPKPKVVESKLNPELQSISPPAAQQTKPVDKPLKTSATVTDKVETKVKVENKVEAENKVDKDCPTLGVKKSMNQINSKSKIEDINAIKSQLKSCLPHTDNKTILQLLESYIQMYDRFISLNDVTTDYDKNAFDNILYSVGEGDKVPAKELKKMPPRVQYLLELVSNDTDITTINGGEGTSLFSYDLESIVALFTPYLPADQKEFIERLAKDSKIDFWLDAHIAISYRDLMERTVFWEDYLKRYPDGRYSDEAEHLYKSYRYFLFLAGSTTAWFDEDYHQLNDPKDAGALERLSERPNSALAGHAKTLLKFMALPDSERMRLYPVPEKDKHGSKIRDYDIAYYQLRQALPLTNPQELNGDFCSKEWFCRQLP